MPALTNSTRRRWAGCGAHVQVHRLHGEIGHAELAIESGDAGEIDRSAYAVITRGSGKDRPVRRYDRHGAMRVTPVHASGAAIVVGVPSHAALRYLAAPLPWRRRPRYLGDTLCAVGVADVPRCVTVPTISSEMGPEPRANSPRRWTALAMLLG